MSATAMAAAQEKAEMLIQKAEKKLKGMFSFGTGKFEEAAEMYGQAAKQFQLAKQCEFTRRATGGGVSGGWGCGEGACVP